MTDEREAIELAEAMIFEWAQFLALLRKPYTAVMLAAVWLLGLKAAGVKVVQAKEWHGKYPTTLPFVLELPCPYGHRTADEYGVASVRLIVKDDGWVKLDPKSPCPKCSAEAVREWLLTCPRCDVGDDAPDHDPEHGPGEQGRNVTVIDEDFSRELGSYLVTGDVSPWSYVLHEFERQRDVAWATWFVNVTPAERLDSEWWTQTYSRLTDEGDRYRMLQYHAERARLILGQAKAITATATATPKAPAWTDETAAAWLDSLKADDGLSLVSVTATVRQAWALVKVLDGHPPKNRVESAQALRKRRATEP